MKIFLLGFVCVVLFGVVCSQNSIRVENGVPIEYQPYYAYIEAHGANSTVGSGTFITRRHVLTSASMVRGYSRWVIGYGNVTFTQLIKLYSYVALMHNNVQTAFWPNRNDVGIILLPEDINSVYVQPIALPITDVPLPRDNEEGLVIGFGDTNDVGEPNLNATMKGVYLQTIASTRCSSSHIVSPLQNTFCASDPYYGSNSCAGTIGSGFVVRSRGEEFLVGILNTFNPLCRSNDVSTYINVRAFLPWIRAIIGDDDVVNDS